ncbi:hypothetical protein FACS1894169_07220 [Bacteroidia bacterium]|nr:hypothetical protein FACS1894169_07220 [Bacteroidia bacterium]
MWRIIDDKGTLYSGSELEMRIMYRQIVDGGIEGKWYGDLLLIQVHDIYR